jgi:tRNA(fMet)-specific endonuclease VapC
VNYLLDSNVCIALMNGTPKKVRERYAQAVRSGSQLFTSSIVAHELWYGVAKSEQAERNARKLHGFLSRELTVLEFSAREAQAAGEIRAELERQGRRIGEYDTLIAGHAFCGSFVMVTANVREFGRVKGLVVEDWTV